MKLKEHPTVKAYLDGKKSQKSTDTLPLKSNELKAIAKECGAEDAAKIIVAGVVFEVTETRPLVAMG